MYERKEVVHDKGTYYATLNKSLKWSKIKRRNTVGGKLNMINQESKCDNMSKIQPRKNAHSAIALVCSIKVLKEGN